MKFVLNCTKKIVLPVIVCLVSVGMHTAHAQRLQPTQPEPQPAAQQRTTPQQAQGAAPAKQQPATQPPAQQVIIVQQGDAAAKPQPRDLKVLEEYGDGKGNIVRVVQYKLGLMRVTETIIMPKPVNAGIGYKVAINPDTMMKDSVTIVVSKSSYSLQVYYRKKIIRNYRAVFGPRPMDNKCMEGDRCTPEGWFRITNKNPASKYNKFMGLSYPNDSATLRFNKLKASGALPATARIGGNVGIHGIWNGGDNMIDMGVGWTDGCVALKNKDIEELYTFVGVGTTVFIKK